MTPVAFSLAVSAAAMAAAALASRARGLRLSTRRLVLAAAIVVGVAAPALAAGGRALALGVLPAREALAAGAAPAPAREPALGQIAPPAAVASAPVSAAAPTAEAPSRGGISLLEAAFGVWAAIAVVLLVRLATGLLCAERLKRGLRASHDPRVLHAAARASAALALRRPLAVGESDAIATPATVGILSPAAALPTGLAATLSDAELLAVLLHEGAHVRRRDPAAAAVARLACALRWPDPTAHLAARRLRAVAEDLADREATASRGVGVAEYAACLVRLAERAAGAPAAPAGAIAMAAPGASLVRRVEGLLEGREPADPRPTRSGRAAAGVFALVAAALCATLSPRAAPADPPAAGDAPAAPPGLVYTGRVLDPDGKPIAGASVWADNGDSYQVLYVPNAVRWRGLVPDPDVLADVGPHTRRSERLTGPDGRFEVAGVPSPVGGWVLAVHPDFVAGRVDVKATGAPAGRVETGDVRLARGASLSVKAARHGAGVAAGAWVVAHPSGPGTPGPGDVRVARTDAQGFATLRGLTSATWNVAAFEEGSAVRPVEVIVGLGGAGEGREGAVALSIDPGLTLRVVVTDRATGAPRSGCRVDLGAATPPGDSVPFPPPGPLASGRTGADGVVEFPGLEEREFEVTVLPEDHVSSAHVYPPPFSVTARGTPGREPLRVALAPRTTLDVRLTGLAEPDAVDEAVVLAIPVWEGFDGSGGRPSEVSATWKRSDPAQRDALIRLEGLRPGKWTVRAWAPGRAIPATDVVTLPMPAGESVSLALTPAEGILVGRVLADEDRRPLAGVVVEASGYVPWFSRDAVVRGTTDGDGRFTLRGVLVTQGEVVVATQPPGRLRAMRPAVRAAGTTDVGDLFPMKSARIVVRTVDARGSPVPHARVELSSGALQERGKGDVRTESSDQRGIAVFAELRPAYYDVRISGVAGVENVKLDPGDDLERTLTVPAK